jgi:hypothetical protein
MTTRSPFRRTKAFRKTAGILTILALIGMPSIALSLQYPSNFRFIEVPNPRLLWGLEDFSIRTLDVVSGLKTVIKNSASDATMGPIIAANPVTH